MKILITGADGQLGSQVTSLINRGASQLGKISNKYGSVVVLGTSKAELDITSLSEVKKTIHEFKPTLVINTAAYTNVDDCEVNIDKAFKVNALGARNLALVCEEKKTKLVHISTDYVFNGDSTIPYREHDLADPINVYGKTKYLAEEYIKDICSKYFIVRTAWLYGYEGKNFVKTIIKAAREKEYLEVVDDQKGAPTNAEDLAYHILKIAPTDEYGIYHCAGKGICSWYDFACKIIELTKITCKIVPVKSEKIKKIAKRPSYSVIDNMMLRCTVGDKMRYWEDALNEFMENYNEKS